MLQCRAQPSQMKVLHNTGLSAIGRDSLPMGLERSLDRNNASALMPDVVTGASFLDAPAKVEKGAEDDEDGKSDKKTSGNASSGKASSGNASSGGGVENEKSAAPVVLFIKEERLFESLEN